MALAQVVRLQISPAESLPAALSSFLAHCKAKNLSSKTLDYYTYRLRAFEEYLESNGLSVTPDCVTRDMCRGFVTSEMEAHSLATANHSVTTLRAFFNYLVDEGFLPASPMNGLKKLRAGRRLVNTFSTEQVEALLATCEKSFVGARDRAAIMMLFDCGLRVSELCGLVLDDISWSEQTLFVTGKGDKDRLVSFGESTRRALVRYLDRRGDLETKAVFVTSLAEPLTRFRVAKIIKARCARANITGVRCSPHTLRHTFAVSYLRSGGDVFSLQKLLGHSDLSMTRRYCELSDTDALTRHRMHSPGDRLQHADRAEDSGRRKRLR
jgi:site-specific recombinase XerD